MANTATVLYPYGATRAQAEKISRNRADEALKRKAELSKFKNGFVGKEAIDAFFRRTPLLGC